MLLSFLCTLHVIDIARRFEISLSPLSSPLSRQLKEYVPHTHHRLPHPPTALVNRSTSAVVQSRKAAVIDPVTGTPYPLDALAAVAAASQQLEGRSQECRQPSPPQEPRRPSSPSVSATLPSERDSQPSAGRGVAAVETKGGAVADNGGWTGGTTVRIGAACLRERQECKRPLPSVVAVAPASRRLKGGAHRQPGNTPDETCNSGAPGGVRVAVAGAASDTFGVEEVGAVGLRETFAETPPLAFEVGVGGGGCVAACSPTRDATSSTGEVAAMDGELWEGFEEARVGGAVEGEADPQLLELADILLRGELQG